MSAVAVFAAFVVGRIIIDNVEELILRDDFGNSLMKRNI